MARPIAANQAQALGLEIASVRKAYGDFVALKDVSLDVRPGEFLTLLGPSGSGKTTLLMTIAGFVRPEAGSVKLGGEEIVRLAPHKRGIGMMFQNYALFAHMSVAQNIAYPLKLRKIGGDEATRRVSEALALVRLEGLGDRRIDELSGGQKQRVALARATVFRPRLLLMDEPLSALDKKLREQMQGELRRLHEELGMTTICVTHDQREALTMSDRVAVMRAGRIEQLGSPVDLYDRPCNTFVADFIGDSILLPVQVAQSRAHLGATVLHTQSVPADGSGHLLIRPERLMLSAGTAGEEASLNRFHGKVTGRMFEGESLLMEVDIGQAMPLRYRQLIGASSNAALPSRGDSVTLYLHPRDTLVLGESRA